VPGPHQVTASVLTSTDQIPGVFLIHGRHRHRPELVQPQQPSQMDRVLGIGLDPIPKGRCSFEGANTLGANPRRGQRP
jgi:hypothetical protein